MLDLVLKTFVGTKMGASQVFEVFLDGKDLPIQPIPKVYLLFASLQLIQMRVDKFIQLLQSLIDALSCSIRLSS